MPVLADTQSDTQIAEQSDDLFPEGVDVDAINDIMNNIPEKDLSLIEKLSLGWQFAQMQATEHPYYCIAGVTVTAATVAALVYYARNR